MADLKNLKEASEAVALQHAKIESLEKTIAELSELVAKLSTGRASAPAPVEKVLAKLPADSTFELNKTKYKLLIPQYSVPMKADGKTENVLFTAEELLLKDEKGNLKNEAALKVLVEGKLNRYILEVK
jgi:hypothetical protein